MYGKSNFLLKMVNIPVTKHLFGLMIDLKTWHEFNINATVVVRDAVHALEDIKAKKNKIELFLNCTACQQWQNEALTGWHLVDSLQKHTLYGIERLLCTESYRLLETNAISRIWRHKITRSEPKFWRVSKITPTSLGTPHLGDHAPKCAHNKPRRHILSPFPLILWMHGRDR